MKERGGRGGKGSGKGRVRQRGREKGGKGRAPNNFLHLFPSFGFLEICLINTNVVIDWLCRWYF